MGRQKSTPAVPQRGVDDQLSRDHVLRLSRLDFYLSLGAELFVKVSDGTRAADVMRHQDIRFDPHVVIRGHARPVACLGDDLFRQGHRLRNLRVNCR